VHAGFADYIAHTGQTLPTSISGCRVGILCRARRRSPAMGVSPTWFIKWSPLLLNLAYLVAQVIADVNLPLHPRRWGAMWIFLAANWVGQDYLSPQGINLFLYLTIVAVLCRAFGGADERGRRSSAPVPGRGAAHTGLRDPHAAATAHGGCREAPSLELTTGSQLLLYGLLSLMIFASISSHQFTPLMIVLMAAALVVVGRTRLTGLWVLSASPRRVDVIPRGHILVGSSPQHLRRGRPLGGTLDQKRHGAPARFVGAPAGARRPDRVRARDMDGCELRVRAADYNRAAPTARCSRCS